MNIFVTNGGDPVLPTPGTLRSAITTANANPGSVIFLNVTPITITGLAMAITARVTIQGNVPGSTIIHNPALPTSALFTMAGVNSGTGVTINSVIIQGAVARSTTIPAITANNSILTINASTLTGLRSPTANGGALQVVNNSILTISSSTITLCNSALGGGIFQASGSQALNNCVISNNGSAVCIGGGGIYNATVNVTINNTTVSGNTALTYGGGLVLTADSLLGAGSVANITNSTFSGNSTTGTVLGILSGGGGIGLFGSDLIMVNSTVANNSTGLTGGGISSSVLNLLLGSMRLANVTVSGNSTSLVNVGGAGIYSISLTPQIGNSILAGNTAPLVGTLSPDGILLIGSILSPFISDGGNVIGTNVLGFTNGTMSDKVGTLLAPLNPGLAPLANYGGPTNTMALLATSPAINNGIDSNPLIVGVPFDQRGSPFVRVVGTRIDSGAFEYQTAIICFDGKSKILVRNIETEEIAEVPAAEVYSSLHEVFSTKHNAFVPIRYNIVNGRAATIYKITESLIGPFVPYEDLYITAGHPIVINGEEVLSHKVEGAICIQSEPRIIYSICTDDRQPILVNGLEVMTWALDDWENRPKIHQILWHDNQRQ